MSETSGYRLEKDSLGEVKVPAARLWGAQTQRAVGNFAISGQRLPPELIHAVALVKEAAAAANEALGLLEPDLAGVIRTAAGEVAEGRHDEEFPVDVYQTGSGTSTNMNVNEVVARRASVLLGRAVHPNDHVNLAQSSNDVIPTAIHLSAALAVRDHLHPALEHLEQTLSAKVREVGGTVKTGRTHLMDAMPVTLGQELGAWAAQIGDCRQRLSATEPRLHRLAIGGTAVGTGVNTHPDFARQVVQRLAERTGLKLAVSPQRLRDLAAQETSVELSGALRVSAVALMKIANDLRWMNSGPLAGLAEIELPALQPGSSIMPGKVNPVIPEAVCMVCARVMGADVTIGVAGQSGVFQLNVMLPLIASELLHCIGLLAQAAVHLADKAIRDFRVNTERIGQALGRNPILVTALNERIGYDRAAAIAKRAYAEKRPVLDVALEETDLDRETLEQLLDPAKLAEPHRES